MTKIYYFSGTGNSWWSAKKIAELLGEKCELFNIGAEVKKDEIILEADTIIFVFPSYAYGLPAAVHRFAKKAVFKTQYVAAFVTYGSTQGGSLAEMRRILKRKKIKDCYFGLIPAVENYLAIFGPPKPKTMEIRLAMQRKATEEASICIKERRTNRVNTFRPFSGFVSMLFTLGMKIFYKYYKIGDNCNGCGVCAKICPVSAIVIKDKQPVFSNLCEHCQGCVNICPLRAIQFSRVKFGTPGYKHPEYKF